MVIKLSVHIKEKLVENWFNHIIKDVEGMYDFKFHNTLQSLKNELDLKQGKTIAIVDVEDVNYSLFTKEYFGVYENIKFIGVGVKKDVIEIVELIKSNISSFVNIESNSLELLRSIKSVENNKIYFCEQTKEHLVKQYIEQIQNNKVIKFNDTNGTVKLSSEIEALTEKEKKVSNLLAQGLSYKDIARLLNVTTSAINQNAKSIYKKLKVRSRAELSYRIYK